MDKEMWYIYIIQYYSATKQKEISPSATTWMDLESIKLSKMSQRETDCVISFICGIKNRLWITRSEVTQSCLTLCDPMDWSLPGSTIHGIFQARILEWVAISFSKRSSLPRDWTLVSHMVGIVGRRFTVWATREDPFKAYANIKVSNKKLCIL